MGDKHKGKFERWFQSADESRFINLLQDPVEKENIRQNLWQNILSATGGRIKKPLWDRWWIRIAAAFILVGTLTLLLYQHNQHRVVSPVKLLSFTTEKGHIKKLLLSDSSEVWLNGGSHIRVSEDFSVSREVYLDDGEAFFHVKEDPSRPFIVHSENIDTRVLGTSFNIKAYRDEPEIRVSVKTGRVQVTETTGNRQETLLPNQQVNYLQDTRDFRKSDTDGRTVNGWTTRRLYYNGTALSSILQDLEKQYGVTFHVESPELLYCLYTVGFESLRLQQVLSKLQILGDLQFDTDNNDIYIKGKGCL